MNKLGDALLVLGMWLWLTIAVGPWWVGVGAFVAAALLNFAQRVLERAVKNKIAP